jgi:hypothetical protein
LTREDIEALTYAEEPVFARAVLRYCFLKFGDDLANYRNDLDGFFAAMKYLETVPNYGNPEALARAVGKMKWNPDYQAIMPICRVIGAIRWLDYPSDLLDILLEDFVRNVHYCDGPAKAIEALGGEEAAVKLIDIMEQTRDRGLGYRKSDVLTVIINVSKPEYSEAIRKLAVLIEKGDSENTSRAIEIAKRYPHDIVDTALLKTAANEDAYIGARGDAIRAIGERKLARARDLVETIGVENPHLHQAVAQALKHIGGKSSLPLLASFLDAQEAVSIYAAESIGVITGKQFEANMKGVEKSREWWKEYSRTSE